MFKHDDLITTYKSKYEELEMLRGLIQNHPDNGNSEYSFLESGKLSRTEFCAPY